MSDLNNVKHDAEEEFLAHPTMAEYERLATKTACYPGIGSPIGTAYVSLKLNGEAGEAAEHVGKAMRDDAFLDTSELTPERKLFLLKECGDVLWYVTALSRELGSSLQEVAAINLNKLAGRSAAGTLQGSGDTR